MNRVFAMIAAMPLLACGAAGEAPPEPLKFDLADQAVDEGPPVDDPEYQAAMNRFDERVRFRNAELARRLDVSPEQARQVEDLLNAQHAARSAAAARTDRDPAAPVERTTGAQMRDIIGAENAEQLDRLRDDDALRAKLNRLTR